MTAEEEAAVTESEVSWTDGEVAVLLRDDAITNGGYGVVGYSGDMTALCIVIGHDVIRTAVTVATMYMYTRGTGITTAGKALLFVLVMVMWLRYLVRVDMLLSRFRCCKSASMLCCATELVR